MTGYGFSLPIVSPLPHKRPPDDANCLFAPRKSALPALALSSQQPQKPKNLSKAVLSDCLLGTGGASVTGPAVAVELWILEHPDYYPVVDS